MPTALGQCSGTFYGEKSPKKTHSQHLDTDEWIILYLLKHSPAPMDRGSNPRHHNIFFLSFSPSLILKLEIIFKNFQGKMWND